MTPMTAEMAGQRPDGFAGAERLGVQDAEVLGSFVVLAHGVGNAGAGVHAAERGADQRQEDGDGFGEHEVLAVAVAEQAVADDDHHVSDGRGGTGGALHGIAGVEEVVGREIFNQVAHQALNQQRGDHGNGNVLGGIFGLAAHRGHRFEANQDENGDGGLDEQKAEFVRCNNRGGGRVGEEVAGGVCLGIVDGEGNRFAG